MAVLSVFNQTIGGKALPATVYVIIALLYFSFEAIGGNVLVLRLLYVLYYLLSVYYMVRVHQERHLSKFIVALDAFLCIILLYVFVDIAGNGLKPLGSWGNMDFLWWHFTAVVPIYSFYYFGKRKMISNAWFRYLTLICFAVAYLSYNSSLKHSLDLLESNTTEITNNTGYLIVSLLPLTLFFSNKKVIQYTLILFIGYFTILSFKRGAILCYVVCTLAIIYNQLVHMRNISISKRILFLIIIFFSGYFLYDFVLQLLNTSDYFMIRVNRTIEGDPSGRNDIYSLYYNEFVNSNIFHFLFGYGVLATRNVMSLGIEAHNDWLEYALDIGLLGLFFYVMYWRAFIKEYLKSRKIDIDISLMIGVILLIYLIKTFVSMSFYNMPFYSGMVLGYCIAMNNQPQIR